MKNKNSWHEKGMKVGFKGKVDILTRIKEKAELGGKVY
jgi:hypothetical protein